MNNTLVTKAEYRRMIDRQWSQHLSGSEKKVLDFIYTMTTEWGKTWERLKARHFIEGFKNVCGIGLSLKTVRRSLKVLTELGMIAFKHTLHGCKLAINYDWKLSPGTTSEADVPLATPKNAPRTRSALAQPKVQSGQNDHYKVAKLTTIIETGDTLQLPAEDTHHSASATPSTPSTAPVTRVRSAIASVEKALTFAAQKTNKVLARKIELGDFDATWSTLHRETFPGSAPPPLTKMQKGQLGLLLKSFPMQDQSPQKPSSKLPIGSFSTSVVENKQYHARESAPGLQSENGSKYPEVEQDGLPEEQVIDTSTTIPSRQQMQPEWPKPYSQTPKQKVQSSVPTTRNSNGASWQASRMDFLRFLLSEWRLIMNTEFKWMVDNPPPEYPDVGFMLKFKDRFYSAWNRRQDLRLELTLTGEALFLKKMVSQGSTREDAKKEWDRQRDVARNRENLRNSNEERSRKLREADDARRSVRAEFQRGTGSEPRQRTSSGSKVVQITEAMAAEFERDNDT